MKIDKRYVVRPTPKLLHDISIYLPAYGLGQFKVSFCSFKYIFFSAIHTLQPYVHVRYIYICLFCTCTVSGVQACKQLDWSPVL